MNKEIWDIFNEKGVLTGKTTVRGRGFLKPGEYHLVVHIWVVSGDGRYLIQRRSENKKLMPGEWAATGGAAISGEDSFTAAKRELFEELSINSTAKTFNKIFRLKRRKLVMEQAHTCKCHSHIVLISTFDNNVISDRSAWLSDIFNTASVSTFNVVREWEECV